MDDWSESKCAGYALAALVAGDRELTGAAGHIPAAAELRTRALIAHEGSADKTARDSGARRRLVERLLAAVRPELVLSGSEQARAAREALPPRLVALLALRLPRPQARALSALAGAAQAPAGPLRSPTRAGFTLADDLWPRLYRIARRSISVAHASAAREHGGSS
jgi:hypothetical protein